MKIFIASIILVFILVNTNAQDAKQNGDSSVTTKVRVGCSSVTNISSPLYIVDGKIADSACIKALDPGMIQSIAILKDKEAAETLYGKQATNGVIIIETKRSSLFK